MARLAVDVVVVPRVIHTINTSSHHRQNTPKTDPTRKIVRKNFWVNRVRFGTMPRYLLTSAQVTACGRERLALAAPTMQRDRKSTRLNSSHVAISYAVF